MKFSAQKGKKGQNSGVPHQGVIGSLGISSVGRPFWICSPVVEFLSRNFPCSSLFIVQFVFLPSFSEVLRKRFHKPPVNAELLEIVIKRQSANHSWRPKSKAAKLFQPSHNCVIPTGKELYAIARYFAVQQGPWYTVSTNSCITSSLLHRGPCPPVP